MDPTEDGRPGVVEAGPAAAPAAGDACERCGGELIPGSLVLPILGRAKFAYNLRGRSIETDVDSNMCARCGLITFTATDPERIRRTHAAVLRVGAQAR